MQDKKLRSNVQRPNAESGHGYAAIAAQPKLPGNGQHTVANGQGRRAVSRQPELRGEGQPVIAKKGLAADAIPTQAEIIDLIRAYHRTRCYAMESRKAANLRLGAFLRSELGWSLHKPDKERAAIAKQALALLDDPEGSQWESVIVASIAARKPFDEIERKSLKEMERLTERLPVWHSFGVNVRGFGKGSLAVIVAEAGELSNYSTKSKLWKRMGLAVFDGLRQGHVGKGLSKDDRAAAYIEHGYSPKRRSRMWNIGDALIKGNRDGVYRAAYLKRKEYELAREPDMRPIHAHRRAQRYMEKRLLRDLWHAWGRAKGVVAEQPSAIVPSPEIEQRAAL